MTPDARPRLAAALYALVAIALPVAARVWVGPPGAIVQVRWDARVDEPARRAFEQRFQLQAGERQEEYTWRYDLRDTSADNLNAIVTDAAVADTHHINRQEFTIPADAARTARPDRFGWPGAVIVAWVDVTGAIFAALALLTLVGARLGRRGDSRSAASGASAASVIAPIGVWFARWVPALDARALGAFRIALGCGFVWVALSRPLTALPLEQQRHRAFIDLDVVHWLAANQTACNAIEIATLVAAVLFAAGVVARISYFAFVIAFTVATLVTLERTSAHDLGLPLVTFLGWLTVPWNHGHVGRALSSLNPARGDPEPAGGSGSPRGAGGLVPSRAYGFAIWWPGLTTGIALLAAGYWKLHQSGLEWITGGAVKYHFIADAGQAAVDWGLWVASHDTLAVLMSLGAIVAEGIFIVNIFMRGPWTRFAAGLTGVGLFGLLYLFQGIYWPAWHVLFLAFLPWSLFNRSAGTRIAHTAPSAALRLATPQVAAVAVLISVQLFASASGTEAEPLMSHFPMYSHNYASIADFERSIRPRMTRVLRAEADGRDVRDVLPALVDNDRFLLMDLAEQPDENSRPLTERERRDRTLLCEGYQQVTGTLPAEVTFVIERRGFDWSAGRFRDFTPVETRPVRLSSLCRSVMGSPHSE